MAEPPQDSLFDVEVVEPPEELTPVLTPLSPYPLRTARKAGLIGEYLLQFVQITRHGVYIDGFAGPHKPAHPETWAAKAAVDVELLTEFHLHEIDKLGLTALEELACGDDRVHVHPGNFNLTYPESLSRVRESQAAFCLFDQKTNECEWSTVAAVADHKRGAPFKIELLYFFPQGWLNRSILSTKATSSIERYDSWWGEPGTWKALVDLRPFDRAELVVSRFEHEFGYQFVRQYPIYDRDERMAYSLIHATDHPRARDLMDRAYRAKVRTEDFDQAQLPGLGI